MDGGVRGKLAFYMGRTRNGRTFSEERMRLLARDADGEQVTGRRFSFIKACLGPPCENGTIMMKFHIHGCVRIK